MLSQQTSKQLIDAIGPSVSKALSTPRQSVLTCRGPGWIHSAIKTAKSSAAPGDCLSNTRAKAHRRRA
eukprot:5349422-Amphidinium_carterae.1